ncbi:hypothetical protein Hanom_Chr12g01179071 [Helianthus anomalus]
MYSRVVMSGTRYPIRNIDGGYSGSGTELKRREIDVRVCVCCRGEIDVSVCCRGTQ